MDQDHVLILRENNDCLKNFREWSQEIKMHIMADWKRDVVGTFLFIFLQHDFFCHRKVSFC